MNRSVIRPGAGWARAGGERDAPKPRKQQKRVKRAVMGGRFLRTRVVLQPARTVAARAREGLVEGCTWLRSGCSRDGEGSGKTAIARDGPPRPARGVVWG